MTRVRETGLLVWFFRDVCWLSVECSVDDEEPLDPESRLCGRLSSLSLGKLGYLTPALHRICQTSLLLTARRSFVWHREHLLATSPFLAQMNSLLCRIADVKPGASQSGLALPFRCWYRYMAEVPAHNRRRARYGSTAATAAMSLRPVHFNSHNNVETIRDQSRATGMSRMSVSSNRNRVLCHQISKHARSLALTTLPQPRS